VARGRRARGNIPPDPGGFFGRTDDLAALGRALDAGERLVTVTGPGGIGKTRLATRFARAERDRFPGGAFFCDLSSCRDLASICARVRATLELPAPPGPITAETLAGQLGDAEAESMLLLLDNVEQVIDPAATVAAAIRDAAEATVLLVTSREALRLAGEVVLELRPVAAPEAIELLVDRVRKRRRSYEPGAGEREQLALIATRLGGLPLALELAAGRLPVVGAEELLRRLEESLDVLGPAGRDAPLRHVSLRATIDWSWQLLDDAERAVLARLSVFHGPFELEAAEAVVGVVGPAAPPTLDLLSSLREKSLLHTPADHGLALYEPIARHAAERLAVLPEADEVRWRHARHHVERVAPLGDLEQPTDLTGARRAIALFEDELRAAAAWLTTDGRSRPGAGELAFAAALALHRLQSARGLLQHDVELATRVLDAFPAAAPSLRGQALFCRATSRHMLGEREAALADLDEALAIAERETDTALLARALRAKGSLRSDRPEESRALLGRALLAARSAGVRREEAITLNFLAARDHADGRHEDALEHLDQSRRLFVRTGDTSWAAVAGCQIGLLDLEAGELDSAGEAFEQALGAAGEQATWSVGTMASQGLAMLDHARGRLDAARSRYEEVVDSYRRVANRTFEAVFLGYLAVVDREAGRLPTAAALLEEVRSRLAGSGDRHHGALFLAHLGGVLAGRGRREAAAEALAAAEAQLQDGAFPGARAVVDLERGHLDLLDLATARREGALGAEKSARRAALRRIEAAGAPGHPSARSLDVRLSLRILSRALGADPTPAAAPAPAETEMESGVLLVHRDARWFRLPAGETVHCASRHLGRRLLLRLVAARLSAPGEPVSFDEMFEAGWPDEKADPRSRKNRLHVAIAGLRKLGLRGLLLGNDRGYLLDPEVALRVVHDP
jgi:predicted ATPase